MPQSLLEKLLEEKGYSYSEEAEPVTIRGTDAVVGRYTIVYAAKGSERKRLGVKDLILGSTPEFFRNTNAYLNL